MSQDLEEYKALTSTLLAFYNYHTWETNQTVRPRLIKYGSLTEDERELLPWYDKHISDIKACIGMNQEFTQTLALRISGDWGMPSDPSEWEPATHNEYDKVRSTILQLGREWSSEGEREREAMFSRIIKELVQRFPDETQRKDIKILNPGCGLGRLVLELVKKGFNCQGNEFSYHMLLTSNFVLNHCKFVHNYSVFPYLHKSSHLIKRNFQIRPITFPDMNPTDIHELAKLNPEIPYEDLMSMTAGSFIDLYGPDNLSVSETYTQDPVANDFRGTNKDNFDVVVTAFFLDTASNIIDYLKTIHYCLKPGGIWINFGPLLWHFEDDFTTSMTTRTVDGKPTQVQTILKGLELSREDLFELVKKMGFKFEKQEHDIETTYSGDSRALGAFVYKCEYWVCRKV